jgi:drug/metabolite transporter (DMT)-like permease
VPAPAPASAPGLLPAAASARAALLLALAGFSILSFGDAVVKTMAGQWPGSGVAALRYSFGAIGLAATMAILYGRRGFAVPRPRLQAGRGAAVALATICFFLAVMAMPLADATAIQFTSPMITGLLAPLVLAERAPRAVWGASALAFAGVLVVLRPNLLALGWEAFYPLGAAIGMSFLMMLNRKAAGLAPVAAMQFLLAVFAAPMLVAAAALLAVLAPERFGLSWPSLAVIGKCALVAATATIGHLLIFAATVRASAAVVAPMTYVQLLAAGALGWAWFGDAPDAATWGGAALIVGGGLLLWRSQTRRFA